MDEGSSQSTKHASTERSIVRARGAAWPLVFDAGGASVAGFFHPPAAEHPRDTAVLVCNPIGWEAVAAHRALRHLAEQLAHAGFPVLRFDYPGTGDSSGDDADPDRLHAWLSGVSAAIDELRRLAKRPKLSLIGFHLGGTLAVLGASAAGGVDSLVLWSPYAKGRVYVREARAYQALNGNGEPSGDDRGGLEAAGFLISAPALLELGELDLLSDGTRAADDLLLLERDERPTGPALVSHFEASGVRIERARAEGYQDMMQEPRKSVVPAAAFAIIGEYLDRVHPVTDSAPPDPPPASNQRLRLRTPGGGAVIEEAITFGSGGHFFGILCEPEAPPARSANRPAILFLTTASHHRVGPNRMYVAMARGLAQLGFTSLRFDLTGVGDTPTTLGVVEGHAYAASFVEDVRAAMDHLERVGGFERFLTVGLCSGAYLGFHASIADARVAGAVLINPQTFNWREGDSLEINRRVTFMSTRHYQRAALDPKVWWRALRGEVNLRGIGRAMLERWQKRAQVEVERVLRRLGREDPDRRVDVADAFSALLKRGADILMIYSGSDEGLDYLTAEVGSRMRRLKKRRSFRLEVIDGPDHTFTQLWAQARLRQVVLDYVQQRFS